MIKSISSFVSLWPFSNLIRFEPYKDSKEDEELLKSLEYDLHQYKETKEEPKNNTMKPTPTIKLDDVSDEDKFFDDFFDD